MEYFDISHLPRQAAPKSPRESAPEFDAQKPIDEFPRNYDMCALC